GTPLITGTYDGDDTYAGSDSDPFAQAVGQAATRTTVLADPNPSVAGQEVLFTILVTAVETGGGVPPGTVALESGAGTLGTADLDENGMATVAATFFEAGAHNVFATYSGDDNFEASVSATLVQTVARSGTDTVLDVSATDVVFSEQVVLTATV